MDRRTKNAVVTLAVGLALNILLGAAKLAVGILSDSASVSSDALNNLSDAAVSVVTIIAAALAARAADHDHPLGHGRYEYIATFVLGAVIVAVGAEVLIGGIKRIVVPADVEFGIMLWVALGASIAVKSFMAAFYFVRGKRTGSETVKAAAVDSVSDVAVTSAVLVCAVTEKFTGAHIDGYASVAVAVVIIVFALRILKRTVSRLLGERPEPELEKRVLDIITSAPEVLSVHDLIINDYGAANKTGEADAVFPAEMSFVDVHAACDRLEREVAHCAGVRLCIHADPLITDDARLVDIRERVDGVLEAYGATAHDLSIEDCEKCVELHVKLPSDKLPRAEIVAQAEAEVRAVVPSYNVKILVDYI